MDTHSAPGHGELGSAHSLCGECGQTAQSTKTWDLNEIKQHCNPFLQRISQNITEWWIWCIKFCTYTYIHNIHIRPNQCMNCGSQYDILWWKVKEIRWKSLELSPQKLKPTGCSWSKSTLPQTRRLMQWCRKCFHQKLSKHVPIPCCPEAFRCAVRHIETLDQYRGSIQLRQSPCLHSNTKRKGLHLVQIKDS